MRLGGTPQLLRASELVVGTRRRPPKRTTDTRIVVTEPNGEPERLLFRQFDGYTDRRLVSGSHPCLTARHPVTSVVELRRWGGAGPHVISRTGIGQHVRLIIVVVETNRFYEMSWLTLAVNASFLSPSACAKPICNPWLS